MSPFCRKDISDTGKVTEALEKAIRTGKMKAGERLDSVRNLAVRFGVGMTAVMRALDRLEKKQLIVRHPRSGVYAAELVPPAKKKILQSVEREKTLLGVSCRCHCHARYSQT